MTTGTITGGPPPKTMLHIGDWIGTFHPEGYPEKPGLRMYHTPCTKKNGFWKPILPVDEVVKGICMVCKAHIPKESKMLLLLHLGYIRTHSSI